MNISAVTYGGHLLTNFGPPKAHYTYTGARNGVYEQIKQFLEKP